MHLCLDFQGSMASMDRCHPQPCMDASGESAASVKTSVTIDRTKHTKLDVWVANQTSLFCCHWHVSNFLNKKWEIWYSDFLCSIWYWYRMAQGLGTQDWKCVLQQEVVNPSTLTRKVKTGQKGTFFWHGTLFGFLTCVKLFWRVIIVECGMNNILQTETVCGPVS